MAEPAAAIAGLIGVIGTAHTTIKLVKFVAHHISRFTHSSAEIAKLHHELEVIETLFRDVIAFCKEHKQAAEFSSSVETLEKCMDACQQELRALQKTFNQPLTPPKKAISRFGKKLKFTFDENAIAESCLALGRQKQLMVASLVILDRYVLILFSASSHVYIRSMCPPLCLLPNSKKTNSPA